MPNLTSILNEQIRRLARREITAQTRSTRRLSAQHRRDIAALKRTAATLQKAVGFLEAQEKRRVAKQPASAPDELSGIRFRADGLKSHRAKLGLSAEAYGRLVGVSGLSIYHWEARKARPRREQIAKLVAVRGLGKREANKRLEMLGGERLPMIVVPHEELDPATLRALIEEFVTRDGAVHGHRDIPPTDVAESILRQLQSGIVVIVFDEASASCGIVPKQSLPPADGASPRA